MSDAAIPADQLQLAPNFEPQLVRSNLLINADRYVLERDIMSQPKAGAGPLGLIMIDLDVQKREVLHIPQTKVLPKHNEMLQKLAFDGVYVNDPQVHQKFNDVNVQKLEERLLNNGMTEFFHFNGELKLNNDLLMDQITRPADLAFEQTIAFQTKEVNAMLSDRMNAFKKKYFRLDVTVGKMELHNCEDLFCEEDLLCLKMKEQFIDYENQVSLAMISFYQHRLQHLEEKIQTESQKKRGGQGSSLEDLNFLEKTLDEIKSNLQKEINEVQLKAQALYDTWILICNLREKQQFNATTAHLKVYKRQIDDKTEITFSFINMKASEEKDDKTPLPSEVLARKGKVEKIKAYCKLFINGKFVSQTKKQSVKYPLFEVELCEVFQVNLFTMPSSMQLELYVSSGFTDKLVDMIEVEVPGQHVKSLTCASQLIQELSFSKFEFEKKIQQLKNINNTKLKTDQQEAAQVLKDEQGRKLDVRGNIFVKAVWQGNGPKMPPIKSENLFKKQKAHKNRNIYSIEEETMMLLKQLYIDVNDPRNEGIIKILKEQKNEFFIKLLQDDAKNLLADEKPFRHKLLQLRARDADMATIPIPLLESEIIDSSRSSFYLEKLEKLFRDEAYLVHLKARIQDKNDGQDPFISDINLVDLETLRRRQLIFDSLKDRQTEKMTQGPKGNIQYKSVVKEFELEAKNPFQAIFSKLFMGGRKLKPAIKKRTAVAFESVEESVIHVHVIKGENVPLRREFVDSFRNFLGQEGNLQSRNNQQAIQRNNNQNFGAPGQQSEIEDRQKGMEFLTKNDLYRIPQVESYVEVKVIYKDGKTIIDRTFCDEGKDPMWNEVKSFPFKPVNSQKFTKEQLIDDETQICITLFDRQKYTQQQEGKTITQEEHRFLGSMTLPLQTVLLNPGKMEFNFKINRPIVLPSYNVLPNEIFFSNNLADIEEQKLRENEQISTYLNISISMEPPLELPAENDQLSYPGFENQLLLQEGSNWVTANNKLFKNNKLKVFGENINGASVLLCRFLTPIKPPLEVVDLDGRMEDNFAIEKAARFVSMIPFIDDLAMFKDLPDVFSSCQEFLDLGSGDYEEHAILLANFFQYIDDSQNPGKYTSYIVFGEAYPEGNSVYVMRKLASPCQDHSIELWNSITGDCYNFNHEKPTNTDCCASAYSGYMTVGRQYDPICPMRKIHCIVSSKNIWANIQKNDSPVLINFNIDDKNAWKPLFATEKKLLEHFASGQIPTYQQFTAPKQLMYATPMQNIQSLESRIQKQIVERFQDERIKLVRKTTKWKFDANPTLRQILTSCEIQCCKARKSGKSSNFRAGQAVQAGQGPMGNQRPKNTEIDLASIINRMDQLQDANDKLKRVWGFPINSTFTSLENLWRQVEMTKLHLVNRQDVEFAISVYIEAYPANVLSVWIYLAAFVDKSIEELSRI